MQIIKNNRYSSGKKKVLVGAAFILIIIAGITVYYLSTSGNKKGPSVQSSDNTTKLNDVNLTPPTSDEVKAGNETKKSTVEQSSSTASTNGNQPFTTTITAANQNGNLLQIRVLIETLSTSGTCDLTLTQGSKSVTKSSDIQANASSSTCKGFDVAVSGLTSGVWNITIKVTIGSQISTTTGTVTIS